MGNSLKVLNPPPAQDGSEQTGVDAVRVAKDVNSKIMKIYGKFLSEDGSAVDYDGIAASNEFQDWKATLQQLHNVCKFLHGRHFICTNILTEIITGSAGAAFSRRTHGLFH